VNARIRHVGPLARLLAAVAVLAAAAGMAAERAQAAYSAKIVGGTLRVEGDSASDKLALRLQAGSPQTLQVDVDDDGSANFSFDRSKFDRIVVEAGGGDDAVRIDEGNGAFSTQEETHLRGEAGNDTLLGGSGAEFITGSDGDDLIDGNRGDDPDLRGGVGADTFVWDPGDGSDGIDAASGSDRLVFNGSGAPEEIELSANGTATRLFRDVASILMDLHSVEQVDLETLGGADRVVARDLSHTPTTLFNVDLEGVLNGGAGDGQEDRVFVEGTAPADDIQVSPVAGEVHVTGLHTEVRIAHSESANDRLGIDTFAGDDKVTGSNGLASLLRELIADTDAGDDTVAGGDTRELVIAGDGDDTVDGNRGDDVALLGAGDDGFTWDPGDGSDTLEGQDGDDTMFFNGSGAPENIDVSANGPRVRFFRDVANITMDLDDVERIDFEALGGADNIVVNDMSGTDLADTNLDLEGVLGGGAGDGQPDSVIVAGTNGNDVIAVTGDANGVSVEGIATRVDVTRAEPANDRLTVNALGGDDTVDASGLAAVIKLTMNGGLGKDLFLGSQGDDFINGGDGDDIALMGEGADAFVWNPGDDNDTLEGQAGLDTMLFNGNGAPENIDIAAVGGRVRFFRNVANVTMDLNDVERIDFEAQGGADTIVVNDVSGTDLTQTNLDLEAVSGGGAGDAQPDSVIVQGTNGDDVALVTGDANGISVLGLATVVNVTHAEAANDRLTINALAGDDVVEASGLAAGAIQLVASGGDGDDVLIGSAGNDVMSGEAGDDELLGGPGLDVLDGGPGDNIVIQD
jgi:Ca2+-binding RTX toxin-like protein